MEEDNTPLVDKDEEEASESQVYEGASGEHHATLGDQSEELAVDTTTDALSQPDATLQVLEPLEEDATTPTTQWRQPPRRRKQQQRHKKQLPEQQQAKRQDQQQKLSRQPERRHRLSQKQEQRQQRLPQQDFAKQVQRFSDDVQALFHRQMVLRARGLEIRDLPCQVTDELARLIDVSAALRCSRPAEFDDMQCADMLEKAANLVQYFQQMGFCSTATAT